MPTFISWKSMLDESIKHATLAHFKNKVCLIIKSWKAMCWEFNQFFIKKEIKKTLPAVLCSVVKH